MKKTISETEFRELATQRAGFCLRCKNFSGRDIDFFAFELKCDMCAAEELTGLGMAMNLGYLSPLMPMCEATKILVPEDLKKP